MENLWQDLRFALRLFRKNLGFSAVAVLTLALGIGANTAIFSVLDPLLVRKLPVQNPDELVWVNSMGTLGPAEISEIENYYAYRDKSQVFSGVIAFSRIAPYNVTHDGRTVSASAELVSSNYFAVLGVRPFAGRLSNESDEHGPANLVLGFDFWKREFGGAPDVIGKTVSFGDQSDASRTGSTTPRLYSIVGVTPRGFFGAEVGRSPDFYMALGATQLPSQDYWQSQGVSILARLKPGFSIPMAQAAIEPLLHEVEKVSALPEIEREENFAHVLLTPAARGLSEARTKFSLPAQILMAVVALLLLIACSNVANLLFAQGAARKREFTVRLALGAGRWRLTRQLLLENTILGIIGAGAGLMLGQWTARLLSAALSTRQFPVVIATGLNGRVLGFTSIVLVFSVVACGLAPAMFATRGELAGDLKTQGTGFRASAAQSRLGSLLIVMQVTLSVMLLAGTGLLLHSLFNLETFDAGFDRDKVLIVTVNGYSASRSRDQVAEFYNQAIRDVSQLPSVRSVAFSSFTPMDGKEVGVNVVVDGCTLRQGEVANERASVFAGHRRFGTEHGHAARHGGGACRLDGWHSADEWQGELFPQRRQH